MNKQSIDQIDYASNIVSLGSCFAENVASKLDYFKFINQSNPFGILFHPIAIENFVTRTINQYQFSEEDLFHENDVWHSFEAHSRLSHFSKEQLLENLNSAIEVSNNHIKEASHIVITLGTAWVYRHITSDKVVANCHKVPQKKFLKELLSIDDISESLEAVISLIRDVNPNATFIFTVSPVRHLKDGFVENTQSKSHLISAVHSIIDPRQKLYYFPSYEIMMDELREYRFYKEDMIHPNNTAINYIWNKFRDVWISDNTIPIMNDVDEIQKGLLHKPFNNNSDSHQRFIRNLQDKIEQLKKSFPEITF